MHYPLKRKTEKKQNKTCNGKLLNNVQYIIKSDKYIPIYIHIHIIFHN